MIHSPPESISRLLKEFKKDKLIQLEVREMELMDELKLKRISEFG